MYTYLNGMLWCIILSWLLFYSFFLCIYRCIYNMYMPIACN